VSEKRSRFRFSLSQRRDLAGWLFISPFLVGFALFFLYPFGQSIVFSFSRLELTTDGFSLSFAGLQNYRYALRVHPTFVRQLTTTVLNTVKDVPLILIFSFFAACLLNQNFRGRMAARVVFFLPVILSAGVLARMDELNYVVRISTIDPSASGTMMSSLVTTFLQTIRIPAAFINYILYAVMIIPAIIRSSGIQILVFLAGLQSVPPSLYEAADVEGATGWERFWLITLPMLSPLVLTNLVYTIVDSFTAPGNKLIDLIRSTIFTGGGYGASTAMAWTYFAFIGVILAIVTGIVSKRVFYHR
jgi:ABC-type sugar transport system permease subunit